VQFGLKNLQELPTLKEFQEIGSLDTERASGPVQANLIEMPAPAAEPDETGETNEAEIEATAETGGEAEPL